MREKLMHNFRQLLWGGRQFKREFYKQLRYLILFTLGFTIAFTWRETLFDISLAFIRLITHMESSSGLSILSSLFITFISLILIFLTSKWFKNLEKD